MGLHQDIECSDSSRLAKAYESNLRAYTVAVAETGNGFVQRNKGVTLTAFPYTYWINGVVSPSLQPIGTLEGVNEILEFFRKLGREVWFTLGPSTRPANLAQVLKKRGLWNFHNRPFMACDLDKFVTGFQKPTDVDVHAVEDYDIFYDKPHPLLKRITTPRRKHIFETFKLLAQQQPRKHWMFIAEKDGKPVGTATIFIDQSEAGIYDVEVLDEFQGQGIGTALLKRVCTFANDQGAKLAVLAASEQGVEFYSRLGFEQTGRYPTYYYSIKKQKEDAARTEAT
jgi:ribosomal protein S18 acetylase RimI-like enzyme